MPRTHRLRLGSAVGLGTEPGGRGERLDGVEADETKVEAEVLRLLIVIGLRRVDDAVKWADETIAAALHPAIEVIEVAQGGRLASIDMAGLLRAVLGEADKEVVAGRVFRELLRELDHEGADVAVLTRGLKALEQWDDLPSTWQSEAAWLDEALYLARSGIHGNTSDVLAELREYLVRHAQS